MYFKKNRVFKIRDLLILILLTIISFRCDKDESDFRNAFYGNFNFTVIGEYWMYENPTHYDTIEYVGKIRAFLQSDSDNDLYLRTDDIDENPNQKITIEFKENKIITSRLSPEGELIQKSGSHYNHEGHFLNFDNIEFTIAGLGGLGYGTNYYVKGVRK